MGTPYCPSEVSEQLFAWTLTNTERALIRAIARRALGLHQDAMSEADGLVSEVTASAFGIDKKHIGHEPPSMTRAEEDEYVQLVEMDIECAYKFLGVVDLGRLLDFDDFNFAHDVFGIQQHIDRGTGELAHCFLPRCSPHEEPKRAELEGIIHPHGTKFVKNEIGTMTVKGDDMEDVELEILSRAGTFSPMVFNPATGKLWSAGWESLCNLAIQDGILEEYTDDEMEAADAAPIEAVIEEEAATE